MEVFSRQNLMELGSEALATLRNSLMRNLWLCPLTNMLPVDPRTATSTSGEPSTVGSTRPNSWRPPACAPL